MSKVSVTGLIKNTYKFRHKQLKFCVLQMFSILHFRRRFVMTVKGTNMNLTLPNTVVNKRTTCYITLNNSFCTSTSSYGPHGKQFLLSKTALTD
jgi:hypothetical protein